MFTLTLREPTTIPIDLSGVLPETMENLSLLEASHMSIRFGNRSVALGELFAVEAKAGPMLLVLDTCDAVQNLGAGMTRGTIYSFGPVGCHAGAFLSGGSLTIHGNTGDWLGAESTGGIIIVQGSAGSQVGAAYRGSRHGMNGGHIVVQGNAGDEVGLLMRRGLIFVHGNCGAYTGASMIAGTILVDGTMGQQPGAGMKRGTIITRTSVAISAGFRYACDYEPQYLDAMHLGFADKTVRCYRGDLMTGGRGEIWQVM